MAKNLYEILEINHDASGRQIKDAYRRLAKKYHPDVNPDNSHAAEQFKEVAHAYWILSDAERRKTYTYTIIHTKRDTAKKSRVKKTYKEAKPKPPPEAPKARSKEGEDIVVRMFLSLEELAAGVTAKVKYQRNQICKLCEGTGIAGGAEGTLCSACRGSGEVPDLINADARRNGKTMPCRKCGGSGLQPMRACSNCEGRGRTLQDVTIKVGIPPGTSSKDKIVVKGQGHEGVVGGNTGDLRVVINQKPHRYFERHGADLTYHCNITFTQWLEGCDLIAPTLNNSVSLTIEPNSMPEGILKVHGKGMLRKNGEFGDLIVKYSLCVPSELNRKQKSLLKRLEATEGFSLDLDEGGFKLRKID